MASREFVDSELVEWTVWYVAPSRSERRTSDTRRRVDRTRPDRRSRRDPQPLRTRVSAHLCTGWLCFESATEKRRLVPVPPSWQRLSDRGLEELCARATAVAKAARQFVNQAFTPAAAQAGARLAACRP